ncbi:MAG: HAMP domain-containing sensor histidine kinase [Coriobacteriaceae bacterium]|nr:HAMP domain-containing sensor histidine kinase [Coriobacteriaceae bacterium]
MRASWNTPHPTPRTGMSYGGRMALSFAMTSLVTVIILALVVTVVWGGAFSDYTRANMEEIANIAAAKLHETYKASGGWTPNGLKSVADSSVISDDIGMQVMDATGKIIYDDTWPAAYAASAGEMAGSAHAAKRGPVSSAPTDPESAVVAAVVTEDGTQIGQVRLWVLGSDALLTKADTAFRERTFNAMGLAAMIAVIASVIVGFLVSRMFTTPIRTITETARRIREGDLSARTEMRGDDEIDQLGGTFDEMAASLERDLKRERRLTSDVAHELRTPLMAIQATVEAMQDGVYPTDAEHLETVAAETRRLARLVQQTLDLSRQENHAAPLRLDLVDIVQLSKTIVNNQHQLFRDKGLHLRFMDETQGKSAKITCDADMITQCIINLMSNAMRYTPEDGWVVVSVKGDRKYVMITVSDTGIGIAKDDLARIFGRFWRADASRAREAGGLGVGLAVTKQIVERHHGFIAVESELEKGTTFTIHLPRELEAEPVSTTMKH